MNSTSLPRCARCHGCNAHTGMGKETHNRLCQCDGVELGAQVRNIAALTTRGPVVTVAKNHSRTSG